LREIDVDPLPWAAVDKAAAQHLCSSRISETGGRMALQLRERKSPFIHVNAQNHRP
jgi:hypothetical protein